MSKYKPNVLVTWREIENYIKNDKNLKKKINFKFYFRKQSISSQILENKIAKYNGLICGDDEINHKVIKKAKNLKIISKWGTGLDSINLDLCRRNNIKVMNTPDAFTKSVSQLAFGYILALSRNIIKIDSKVRNGIWPKFKGQLIDNRTVGIIGFGKIGQSLGKLVKKNNMNVIFYDIKNNIRYNKKLFRKVKLEFVLRKSDFLVICCDLNDKSRSLIRYNEMNKMKNTAYLINVARGPILKEKDLIKSLHRNIIAGAALDVFEYEPIKKQNSLKKVQNCILGSHNAFNTIDETERVNKKTLQNLIKYL